MMPLPSAPLFGQPLNCSSLTPVDMSPKRSPLAVHNLLSAVFSGRDVVEAGTRYGDGLNCWGRTARSAGWLSSPSARTEPADSPTLSAEEMALLFVLVVVTMQIFAQHRTLLERRLGSGRDDDDAQRVHDVRHQPCRQRRSDVNAQPSAKRHSSSERAAKRRSLAQVRCR